MSDKFFNDLVCMPKYLFHGSYIREGLKGCLKKGDSKRKEIVEQTVNGMGGRLKDFITVSVTTICKHFETHFRNASLLAWWQLANQIKSSHHSDGRCSHCRRPEKKT